MGSLLESFKLFTYCVIVSGLLPFSMALIYGGNISEKYQSIMNDYTVSPSTVIFYALLSLVLGISTAVYFRMKNQSERLALFGKFFLIGSIGAFLMIYFSDMLWLTLEMQNQRILGVDFSAVLGKYLGHSFWIYICVLACIGLGYIFCFPSYQGASFKPKKPIGAFVLCMILLGGFSLLPILADLYLFKVETGQGFISLTSGTKFVFNIIGVMGVFIIALHVIYCRNQRQVSSRGLIQFIQTTTRVLAVLLAFQGLADVLPYFSNHSLGFSEKSAVIVHQIQADFFSFIPLIISVLFGVCAMSYYKKQAFDDNAITSGNFGTAAWMTEKEYREEGLYDKKSGPPVGMDNQKRLLHMPLLNTLVLAPPGMGKSLRFMQALLTENRPMFVLDVKGELAAVSARYRAQTMGRRVVILDFYNILHQMGCDYLRPFLKHFNPFDFLSENVDERNRMLTSFAEAFIVSESNSGASRHFEDNAKILIRGYIDYIMKNTPDKNMRNLNLLYRIMCLDSEKSAATLGEMQAVGGHAAAAANQLLQVGKDEKGSILSTTYRQIDWLSDTNIQKGIADSNFDLWDFLSGNMDIFLVVPGDQVREQSRLVRMMMALLKAMIIQSSPAALPQKKMLFMLDELGQFDYCPDIEQFIELLRSYRVTVWAVFQTLSQIKIYKKSDLFLGMPIKQFFTFDDVDTMKWLQTLGGKDTVQVKSQSMSSSDSHQKMQVYGGNVSKSEGENVHEAGIDLIKLNEIREMPFDEQIIFWLTNKPIKCKKVIYYEHAEFYERFDENPLEKYKAN